MSNSKLVYSSEHGRVCRHCGRPLAVCKCNAKAAAAAAATPGGHVVRVGRETKGRKGKGVTVVVGVPLASDALEELATRLKRRCGSGGTVRQGVIEIQGDHRDTLVAELGSLGYTVKRAGG